MAARGFVGSGDLYIERYVAGVSQGMEGPFEASKFEIKPNVERLELTSKGKTTRGQVLEAVAVAQPSDFSVELPEVNKESLTIALLGTAAALSQTSGTITDEAVTAKLGKWVAVSKGHLTSVVVEHTSGSPTYVLGTDYEVNAELGWIKAIAGGAITEAQSVNVSASAGAIAGTRISGGTNTDIRAKFVLDGVNAADGLPCVVTVWEGIIAADAAFDFLADDFNTVSMPGKMKTPTGKTEPFVVELRSTAVGA